ncbi:MAG: 1-deoxy-D-xylulose-5-phosphate reductoisomerase [Coriobacteriales bacterium]|nr:1-deoxy-D-xylulose-5-phosphate reductoisomerase [Coriobacteriales bacterium]
MSIFADNYRELVRPRPIRLAVIGATGSIGSQTLDVCRHHADKVQVTGLAVNDSVKELVSAAREFGVMHVAIGNEAHRGDPLLDELPKGCEVGFGSEAVAALAASDAHDYVMNSVVGALGITVAYAALKADKTLLYANKESIVVGGDLLMPMAKPGQLIPVDSEHYAIFECLLGERLNEVYCLWLTCSGGPFYGWTREQISTVTAAQALAHPNWSMGPKITVDCATLMNKGLEVIEAHHLFDVPIDMVRVLVHRQSRIHSMVEFIDGTVKAQLGPSDMRNAIQGALSFPDRWETSCPRDDYWHLPDLSFGEADEATFRCLALAKDAGRTGGTLPCVMNAANEVANAAFRKDACGFLDIERVVEDVMGQATVEAVESLQQLSDVDAWARERATKALVHIGR